MFLSPNSLIETVVPSTKSVSPASTILIFEIILLTTVSICLSLTSTPCDLYTFWTSLKIYSSTVVGSVTASNSFGLILPSVNAWPASTIEPFSTLNLALYRVTCSLTSTSFVI